MNRDQMPCYVYILRCADQTLYTGWTDQPERRLRIHNDKKGAKYTRSRTPVELVYLEALPDKSSALKREYEIKQWNRIKKETLIAAGSPVPLPKKTP